LFVLDKIVGLSSRHACHVRPPARVSSLPESVHPIQVVARRTGLSADLIRAWERRYAAVSPQRTATRRRLYSDADVQRLCLLRAAVANGRRIGDVAALSCEHLAHMLDGDGNAAPATTQPSADARSEGESFVQAALAATLALDARALTETLDRAAVGTSVPALLEETLAPFLRRIGESWREGSLRVCHEHLATSTLRRFLFTLEERVRGGIRNAPVMVLTTPVGQVHEFGVLMASVVATASGWTPVNLGTECPVDEIAHAALTTRARVVALGLTWPGDDSALRDDLRRLRSRLPESVTLIAGGEAAGCYRDVLDAIGARRFARLDELRSALEQLRAPSDSRGG